MTFKAAQRKLKKIVGGKYRSLTYEKTFRHDGTAFTTCSIYVEKPGAFYRGHDWDEAFAELEKGMNPKPIEETPE